MSSITDYFYFEIIEVEQKGSFIPLTYILKIFKEDLWDETVTPKCIETLNFPVTNQWDHGAARKRAELCGKSIVADLKKGGAK